MTKKHKTLGELIKDLQEKVFNPYIRLRDSEDGWFKCISCQVVKPIKGQMNAGHYFSVGDYSLLRFEPDNVHGQCVGCNKWKHGNLIPYREHLIEKIGTRRFNILDKKAKAYKRGELPKFTRYELEEIKKEYTRKLKEL